MLHAVNNGFYKSLEHIPNDIPDLIIKIYYFFHNKDKRLNNFEKCQKDVGVKQHHFILHVSTRWLKIGPAAERVTSNK